MKSHLIEDSTSRFSQLAWGLRCNELIKYRYKARDPLQSLKANMRKPLLEDLLGDLQLGVG